MANRYQDRPFPTEEQRRSGDQPRGSDADPLAELARLIGQTDPFGNPGRSDSNQREAGREPRFEASRLDAPRHGQLAEPDAAEVPPPQPSWIQRAKTLDTSRQGLERLANPPAPAQPDVAAQGYNKQGYDDHAYESSPSLAAGYRDQPGHPEQYAEQDRYDDALFGQMPAPPQSEYAESPYTYQDEDDADYDQLPKRRGGMVTVAVVVALAVLGTGGALTYRTFLGSPRSGEPPVIRADAGPNKIVPPSANADASAKLSQDRLAAGASEQLVSREEQPVNVEDNTKAGPRVVFPPLNQNANPPSAASVSPNGKVMTINTAAQGGDEPRRVRTLSVRGDQADGAPVARPAPARPVAVAPTAPIALTPQARAGTTASIPQTQTGNYLVQVASQRNEAEALSSFRVLKAKYPAVLGSSTASIKRADLGDKGVYYRAMVGPFGTPDDASRFCGSLKSAGGQCIVQRN